MGLSRTISEINGDFRRKSHFPHIFCAPSEWVFLGNGYWLSGSKKHNQGPTGLRNNFYLLPSPYNRPTWQTDSTPSTAKTARTHSVAR